MNAPFILGKIEWIDEKIEKNREKVRSLIKWCDKKRATECLFNFF